MRVSLGVDPGTAAIGLGVIGRTGQAMQLLHAETVRPKGTDLVAIIAEIQARMTALILQFHPLVVGIEDQLGVSSAARTNQQRQIMAIKKGQMPPEAIGFNSANDGVLAVQGALIAVANAYRKPVELMQPQAVKIGILGPGSRQAEKKHVKEGLCRAMPSLRTMRVSLNATDALAVAVLAESKTARNVARAG